MAWGKADDYLEEVFSQERKHSIALENASLLSSLKFNRKVLNELIEEVNQVLGNIDNILISKGIVSKDEITDLDSITVGVGPFGGLGMLVEGYAKVGDTLFMPLDSDRVLYAETTQFSTLETKHHLGYSVERLFTGSALYSKSSCLTIRDGFITVYKNGLGSGVSFKYSILEDRFL